MHVHIDTDIYLWVHMYHGTFTEVRGQLWVLVPAFHFASDRVSCLLLDMLASWLYNLPWICLHLSFYSRNYYYTKSHRL